MYKMVRKCGQNWDFTKFHYAPKNEILNMIWNAFGGVERTLWTLFGCHMEVWTLTDRKASSPLTTSWFWAFFRRIFNKSIYLGNKRSAYVTKIIHIRKLTLRATKNIFIVFGYDPYFFLYLHFCVFGAHPAL